MKVFYMIVLSLILTGCLNMGFGKDTYMKEQLENHSYIPTIEYKENKSWTWGTFLRKNQVEYDDESKNISFDNVIGRKNANCKGFALSSIGRYGYENFIGFVHMRNSKNGKKHVVSVFKNNLIIDSETSYYVSGWEDFKLEQHKYNQFNFYNNKGDICDNIIKEYFPVSHIVGHKVVQNGIFINRFHCTINGEKVKMGTVFSEVGEHKIVYYLKKDKSKINCIFPDDFHKLEKTVKIIK